MSNWLDTLTLRALESGLDAASLRQRVLTDNIANVDTPGFKRSDVDFPSVMAKAMRDHEVPPIPLKMTSEKHLPGVMFNPGLVVKDNSTTWRNDGNNVDIEREMANLAKNGLYYNSLVTSLDLKLAQLRTVIRGDA